MSIGDEYVLFLKRVLDNNQEKLIMIGGPNGKFKVNTDVIAEEIDKKM